MPDRLTEEQMIDILEGLARSSSSATAQIAAIKMLREIRSGEATVNDAFAELDESPKPHLKAV